MPNEIEQALFGVAKSQDQVMHNLSAEMSVKTSLYLVFTAFVFSASIQLINLSKDAAAPCSRTAIELCGTSAAFSLCAGIMLLIAALVREYKTFPTRGMVQWVKDVDSYRRENPNARVEEPLEGILLELIDTAEVNQTESEKKARWVTRGALFLFTAIGFLALAGGFALYAFLNRPF
ncbi:MAG TPA: hypothetical protein VLV49_13645 [Terriglobales bacterium]|nr:hypothetical protein [Terriglobales bacterium]